jgi:hypothetical protein
MYMREREKEKEKETGGGWGGGVATPGHQKHKPYELLNPPSTGR